MSQLPYMGGNPDTITLSGFSSGGFMSHLTHVIFSDTFKGVGIFSGGPYGCNKFFNNRGNPVIVWHSWCDTGFEHVDISVIENYA